MANKITSPQKGFTDAFIKYLKPQEKRYEIPDKGCSGLCIRVGKSGKKSFIWYYEDSETGKRKMLTLGRYGKGDTELSLAEARQALETTKIKHNAGELNTVSDTPKTVSELCDIFYKKKNLTLPTCTRSRFTSH